ncbi:methyltransferase LaeA [Pseudovirgaria hyperparasitica]|uniref:Methyltransferase LaeA n=1 Tax=Pseudovirgaria hyperparasitica TaxID=470096 RepID=A0A6A6WAC3_9PEZI|nr:methyltransferase LaeA [Pseudovirgaria hyperparasitica]KAF2758776.1 methyltransferase LaeA [Pseudovirgaria hyperparasitica]
MNPVAAPADYDENGRTYHGYRRGIYMYPCDEIEKERMDMMHQLFDTAFNQVLQSTPALKGRGQNQRILDLGCGTGIWALDIADAYPEAEVIGVDLSNIQPAQIAPNLQFRVPFDYEGALWTLGENSFDLIHLQMACGSVSNWNELYNKIYRHLTPGSGWIEHIEMDLTPRCDDGSLPASSHIRSWYNYLVDATSRASKPIAYNQYTRQSLAAAGFIDISERVIRVPYNRWPTDPRERKIADWHTWTLADETCQGLEALSMAPFTRCLNWRREEFEPFLALVRTEMKTRRIHAYNNIHVWTARKPQS